MKVNRAADIAFLVGALALVAVLVKSQFFGGTSAVLQAQEGLITAATLPVTTQAKWHVVVFISSSCRFCEMSMPFYGRLREAARNDTFDLLFESPEKEDSLRTYLDKHGLGKEQIQQGAPPGARGTPTLIVLDAKGAVKGSWTGKMSDEQEKKVLLMIAS